MLEEVRRLEGTGAAVGFELILTTSLAYVGEFERKDA
jgi:hypothetical protein